MSHPHPQKYTSKRGKVYEYDARKKLAIDEVDSKCDAIVTAASEGCETICKEISNVQIGNETLCVADSSLEPALEEVGLYIKSIASEGVQPTTEEIKSQAAAAFVNLQNEEDARAEADCAADNKAYEAELAEKQKAASTP